MNLYILASIIKNMRTENEPIFTFVEVENKNSEKYFRIVANVVPELLKKYHSSAKKENQPNNNITVLCLREYTIQIFHFLYSVHIVDQVM